MKYSVYKPGFSLVEIILAIAVFALLITSISGAYIYGRQSTQLSGNRSRAAFLGEEALEAVRSIANPNYSNLSNYSNGTNYYLNKVANQWQLTTIPQQIDGLYTRTINFADGPNGTREVRVSVTWQQTLQRPGNFSATTYFSNWRQPTAPPDKSGLLVYANGGTNNDTVSFRQLLADGTWTNVANIPDFDIGSSNRVARSLKLFSAKTGSAKMLLSRHYDGTKQYLYATYWNGTNWLTPTLLAQWTSPFYINVGNFSGDFLADNSFLAVYSDGTFIPKSRIFNGTNWSSQVSMGPLNEASNYPTNIVVKARPQTNEAMAAFLGFDYDTDTNLYSNGAWQGYVKHAQFAVGNNSKQIDLAWSGNDPTKALLLHTSVPLDRTLRIRTYTATGLGLGYWSLPQNTDNQPTGSIIGSLTLASRHSGATEWMACDKDLWFTPKIYCYKVTESGFAPRPQNYLITNSTDNGLQISFDLDYLYQSNNIGLNLYSDNTNSAKVKRFDSSANSWDANPVLSLPSAADRIQKTKVAARPNSDDAMMLVADRTRNLYSVVYNGQTSQLYSAPSGKAWTSHATNGPDNDAVWFDFEWDN